jgi:ketosteroid isomerase-like protein
MSYQQMLGMIDEEVRHFPDRRMQIRRLVVDGDEAAIEYEWLGTAAQDMGPLRKGEVQRWHNLLFVTLRDGKMIRAREYGVSPAGAAAE